MGFRWFCGLTQLCSAVARPETTGEAVCFLDLIVLFRRLWTLRVADLGLVLLMVVDSRPEAVYAGWTKVGKMPGCCCRTGPERNFRAAFR